MHIDDITSVIANHAADLESDEYSDRFEWITDGLSRLIVNALGERGLEVNRRNHGLVNVFAEIAAGFMLAQNKHDMVTRGVAMMRESAAAPGLTPRLAAE